jgi:hypothetical protein
MGGAVAVAAAQLEAGIAGQISGIYILNSVPISCSCCGAVCTPLSTNLALDGRILLGQKQIFVRFFQKFVTEMPEIRFLGIFTSC